MSGLSFAGAVLMAIGVVHLVYTWALYPWLVRLLPARAPRRPAAGDRGVAPRLISVVIAARVVDDAQVAGLAAKVRHLLASITLPHEIVVALDEAGDVSLEPLRAIPTQRFKLIELVERQGKAVALNRGVAGAAGDVLVFTDLRQQIEPGAVEALIQALESPDMGAVSGALALAPGSRQDGLYERYWRYERTLRAREAAWDSAVGVSGALYALKRDLWRPLPPGLILDDVWVPFQVIAAGKRVGFVANAVAVDRGAGSDAGELARKVRTLTGNYQLLAWMPALLNPWSNRIWWQFMSHKVLRLLTPLALACIGAGMLLVAGPLMALALLAVVTLAWVARSRRKTGPGVGVFGGLRTAQVLVFALVAAALNALRGRWDVWSSVGGGPR